MDEREDVLLAELTTLRVGGAARRLVEVRSAEEIVEAVVAADAVGEPMFVLAGGSNLLIADEGFEGTVVHVVSRGVSAVRRSERVQLLAAAGEPWDEFVTFCVDEGLAGVECLSGIPGSTGATPIQNVGAYGQEVARTVGSIRAYDRETGVVVEMAPAACGFAYRSSAFRRSSRYVVLGVSFVLERSSAACPVRHAQLAHALAVAPGARPPLSAVRDAVVALRREKGMVIDPGDPDSVSAGSFFVNPILSAERFIALERLVSERCGDDMHPPAWRQADGRVKTSAAWLIERAGFHRGYGTERVGVSRKHTLALVNRGGATAAELVALARELRDGVRATFGVTLQPEPTLVGVKL